MIAAAALWLSLQQPHSPITVGSKHKKLPTIAKPSLVNHDV